jgi:hypothetical protein
MVPEPAKEENLAGFLSPAFGKAAFSVDRSKPLTFVCGGNNRNGNIALRHQFLEQINKLPPQIIPVLAEQAFPHQLIERNLQKFEEFLASAADCILIFVESPGSFAETGLFAGLKTIVPRTFIINTQKEAVEDSFLNNGPIKLIRKFSRFDKIMDLPAKVVTDADADKIVKGILSTYPKYRNALVFHPEKKFVDLDLRLRLACVHLTVTLMRAGSALLVTSVLRRYFTRVDAEMVERFLSLLTSIKLLERADEIYFNPRTEGLKDDALIRSVSFSVENVGAQALEWQAKNNSHVATFLRDKRGVDI